MRALPDFLQNLVRPRGVPWSRELSLSIAIVLGVLLVRWLLVKMVERREVEMATRYRWRKTVSYLAAGLVLLLLGFVWFEQFQSVSTFLGLLSAGLAIALKDFVTAVAGWLFLLLRKPFEVGDRIEIGGYRGDVIDVRIFKFTLVEIGNWVQADQSTGRIIHLPNNLIIQETITNYTRGFRHIWNEIEVLVTFESDWRRAKAILTEIAERQTGEFTDQARNDLRQAASRYMLYFTHLTPIVYTRIADSGVLLTLRHICPPRRRRGVEESIAEEILTRFAEEPEIDLAYPTTRLFRHDREGKAALRPGTGTLETEPDPD